MKIKPTLKTLLASLLIFSFFTVVAEEKKPAMKFYDVLDKGTFRMINRAYGYDETGTPFTRLPKVLKDSVRPTLWDRSLCTSGYGFRFATDSKRIGIEYNLLWNAHLPHMAYTGIKGTDLYILRDDGVWEFVNCNRPTRDSIQTKTFVENLDGKMHEYMLYLPLYDGINWMRIGVDSTAYIGLPQVPSPALNKKIVFYGTSVLQGGCATRPGMVGTSIIQRDLDVECVNLGFSGEGKMDFCMARAMAQIPDVVAYVLDPIPNCTEMMCDTLTYDFVKILRTLRPDVPIFMVEGMEYSYEKYDSFFRNYLPRKNEKFHNNYLKLKAENPDNLYYIDRYNQWGPDNEGTVDGIHLTDIGFYFYAKKIEPYLEPLLKQK
ncbi:MAG: SGNH/GDSL hydrolase family protein [Muribaculaceae bacterium]|nr:SGNH/GDSL hydrolase family protein [Muribaculaceae bacterium]